MPLMLDSHTDRIVAVQSRKTIYVRFDLNDYSIPPEAVGRPLTLAASDTHVRILDGPVEIASHRRSYDRQRVVADPAHEEALLRTKRKALHATRGGRLAVAVPKSESLLERAIAAGESAGSQTAQLLRLLDLLAPGPEGSLGTGYAARLASRAASTSLRMIAINGLTEHAQIRSSAVTNCLRVVSVRPIAG